MPWLDGKPKTGISIAIPYSGRPTSVEWGLQLMLQGWPMNLQVALSALKGKPVDEARTTLVEKAIEHGSRFLFFVDDDVIIPINGGRKLYDTLNMADNKTMVVAGIYPNRDTDTPEPMIFRGDGNGPFWHWKVGDIFPVTGAGTGCMMINLDVFKYLEKPWFKLIDKLSYYPEDKLFLNDYATDDLYFCKKVIDAGFKILCDGAVICAHQNALTQKIYHLPENSFPFRAEVTE